MQRVKISLLCLLSLSLAGVLAAQTAVDPNSDAGSASLQDFSGGATLRGTYFDVRHMSGDGVGYKNGYTQIGAFTPFWLSEDAFIAPNARLLLTDNSGIGLNAGLVARRYDSGRDRILGLNGYFDTDETKFGNRYNQVGIGVESLGQFLDFRANAYAAMGEDTTFIRPVGLSGTPFFFENRIGLIGTRLMEQALSGGDFEAGVPVSPQTPWLRAFGGAYAYQQDLGDDPVGFRGRLEAWISDDLSLGVTATWDKQFDTNVNFVADWRFSGFKPTRYFPQWTTRERMLMPVQRQWRVTAGNYNEDVNILAFNPRDNQPYFVVWYDNSAGGLNDGTFENPYNTTLTHAIPNETDLVLVRRGNTTQAAPLNGSITLPNFARMLGEGKAHIFDAYGDFGPFHVVINDQVLPDPAFTDPARANRYPFLTNADAGLNGGDIIRVGSNNEVSALVLEDATGRAIFGNNVQGFHFNNLEITNNIGGGIVLQDASGFGPVTLDGQTITGAVLRDINTNPVVGWSFVGTGLGDNAAGGINIDTLGGLALTVTNVAMNSNPSAQLFGIRLLADDGPLTTTFTDVQTNGFAPGFGNTTAGIIIGETGETVNATFNNVSASNNTGIGMQVTGTGGIIHLFSDSLTANANGLDNLQIGSQGAPLVGTTFLGTFSNSFFNDSLAGSGIVYSQSGGTGTLNLTNIQANSNGVDGLGMFGAAASVMNVNVQDSSLTVNTRDAFHVEQIGGSTINLLVNTADGSVSGRDGLFFNLASGSRLNATFLNDNLSNSGRSAVHGEMDASTLVLDFNTTTGDLSGEHGLFLDAVNGSNALMFITDGTFVDSSQNAANTFDGIHISSDASFVGLTMRNTPSNNTPALPLGTQRHGMFLDIQNGSTFGGLVADGNLTNSRTNALNATFGGNSTALLVLDNTPLDNSGADGMHVVLTGAATNATINLQNGTTNDNSGQDGLDFAVDDGTLNVSAATSSFTNSGAGGVTGNGILGVITNTGLARLTFLETPVTGSLNNGMFVTATGGSNFRGLFSNSSFNGNGLTTFSTTELDGIRLVLDGSPNSSLQLVNGSTVDGNGGDGFQLIATNLTFFTGDFQQTTSFSDNGQNVASLTKNGVSASVDNSIVNLTFTLVDLHNNLPNSTQAIGFHYRVQNGGALTADFTASDLSDNNLNAFNGLVNGAGSSAIVNGNLVTANTSGADGAIALVFAGGRLDFNLLASSIDSSGATGLVGTSDGAGSLLNVSLDGSTINTSSVFGAFLNASAGGTLNFDGINNSSISTSGAAGVSVTSTGANSLAQFGFDTMALNDNGTTFGGEGFIGSALDGGTLNVCLENSTVLGNTFQGIDVIVAGTDSLANFGVDTSTINDNGSEGLLVDVSDEGVINYRSQNSSYTGNGTSAVFPLGFDGVHTSVTGTGPADTVTTARYLFSGDTVDGNSDDGFEFNADNGATLVVSIENGTSASNNSGYGLRFNPNGAGTKAYLLMSGPNQFNNNGLGSVDINGGTVTGIDTAVISLSGSFDNANGDGVHIEVTDVANVIVAVQGPGTIDGSQDNGGGGPADNGDGIDIRLTNNTLPVMNGSILIGGFSSIGLSAADGIHIEMTNNSALFNGALEINGIGSIAGSGDDAVDIALLNMTMLNNLTFPAPVTPILVLTLADSVDLTTPLSPPGNLCLPVPVPFDLNTSGLVPASAFTINDVTADNSAGRGINIFAQNSTIDDNGFTAANNDNGMSITNNSVSNSLAGDGLHIDFDNVTGPGGGPLVGVLIDGNGFSGNSDNGINFDLLDSPIDQLTITNNTGGGTSSNIGLLFLIVGNTFGQPFSITNTSNPGIDLLNFNIDITPSGNIWDTVEPGSSIPFAGQPPSDTLTGLATVNGNPYPNALPGGGVPDDQGLIDLSFTDFDASETFTWDIDSDGIGLPASTVLGSDLIGSPITVNFTGGLFLTGFLSAVPGDPTASTFVATGGNLGGGGLSSNSLDGIRFSLNNSSLTNLVMDNNEISSNGTTGIGHGVNFQTVNNSDITNATVSNNSIDANNGDGFRLVNPDTAGAPIDLTFQDNTITNNTGAGINLQINNAEIANVNIESVATGNQISNNTSFGVHLVGANTSQINLTMGGAGAAPNTLNGNGDAGTGLDLRDTATATVNVSNTTFSGTVAGAADLNFNGEGLAIHLTNFAVVNNAVIGDAALANTNFNTNASHGIDVEVGAFAQWTNPLIQNILANGNTGDGLHVLRDGNGIINGVTITDSTFTANSDGIDISAQFALLDDDYTITNNLIDNNNANGIRLNAQADARVNTILTNNTITNNGDNGVLITTTAISPGDAAEVFSGLGDWTQNVFSTNGRLTGAAGAGIEISGNHTITLGTVGGLAGGNIINTNAGDGIEINREGTLNVDFATIRFNNTEGSGDGLAGIDLNSTVNNTLNVSNSVISNNLGDGLELDNSGVFTTITLTDNLIQFNTRDGVEFMDRGFGTALTIQGTAVLANQIVDNGFRGIDIVVAGGDITSSTVNIDNTDVLRNGQEGIYAILSSDAAQTTAAFRDNLASAALSAAAGIGSTPLLNLNLTDNRINQNGQVAGNIGGSGIVLLVGTTGRVTNNFNDPGGTAGAINGGVISTMTGNSLTGNFGADVLFESFRSTVNPNPTGGTWTDQNENPRNFANDVFNPTGYQTDPLARLDLVFNSNMGDELDATRQGAFYNNDEPIFKSRTQNQDNATDGGPFDDPGPFGSGSRNRNAQRNAARDVNIGGTQLPPTLSTGLSDLFLFPGMGTSTFRVDLTGGNVFGLPTATSNFLLDGNPYIDFTDANGNPLAAPNGGPLGIDNMPWGWSVLP